MNPADFDYAAQLLKQRSGLIITQDKLYLLESRLSPIARREGYGSVDELLQVARGRRDERLVGDIVDAMTTNETFFFRDTTPFQHLKEYTLPALATARQGRAGSRIRIWCAACSTGQEPYSIAMMLEENPGLTAGIPVQILATDISDRVLEKGRSGLYTQFEVQRGLPIQMLIKHFNQQGEHWKINDKLKANITWRNANLLGDLKGLGQFDVVFCRNVLIYFDPPTKRTVLGQISNQMASDGYLMLGAAETVIGVTDAFKNITDRRGVYQRNLPESGVRVA
jgi:chemotaxis protein methyltransferase CheR